MAKFNTMININYEVIPELVMTGFTSVVCLVAFLTPLKNRYKESVMTYNPINENIVIEEIEEEAVTASGIIIENTEAADVIVPKGRVISISPTVKTGVEVGDTVIYPKYSGLLLEKGIRILEIDQVLAVCHS